MIKKIMIMMKNKKMKKRAAIHNANLRVAKEVKIVKTVNEVIKITIKLIEMEDLDRKKFR